MAAASQGFSLRPWPTGNKKPKNIAEFVSRMNVEHGGFRNVHEADLRKELEVQDNAVMDEDVDMDAESESDDGENRKTVPEINAAREQIIRTIDHAHGTSQLVVDVVSLLLSKEIPAQAVTTLSPALREQVGIGTIGADKLAVAPITDDTIRDNKAVATGWKFLDIEKTVDSLVSSASRLHRVMERETKYWAGVLAVSEGGWAVSSLSDGRGVEVKFGFSEAAAGFGERPSAPLKLGPQGDATLSPGASIGRSQRILVSLSDGGKIVGRSDLPQPLEADASVDMHVLEARDTIFARELWHEISREGRSLLSHHTQVNTNSITVQIGPQSELMFQLVALDVPPPGLDTYGSYPQDVFVESISSALHILLSYAHRQNHQRRSQPTPLIANQNRSTVAYSLIRPIIAHLEHEKQMKRATAFFADLVDVLRSAGISTASYTLVEPPTSLHLLNASHRMSPSEALCAMLLNPREFLFEFTITPEVRISVRGRSLTTPFIAQQYQVQLPSSGPDARNPLQDVFPPSDGFPSIAEVSYYIRQATVRVLAILGAKLARRMHAEASSRGPPAHAMVEWKRPLSGMSVCDAANPLREVRFNICQAGSVDPQWEKSDEVESPEQGDSSTRMLTPDLRLYASWPDKAAGKIGRLQWLWTVEGARNGSSPGNLNTILRACFLGQAQAV